VKEIFLAVKLLLSLENGGGALTWQYRKQHWSVCCIFWRYLTRFFLNECTLTTQYTCYSIDLPFSVSDTHCLNICNPFARQDTFQSMSHIRNSTCIGPHVISLIPFMWAGSGQIHV
jgi:hypothetical protein